jgi:hypothetical protein
MIDYNEIGNAVRDNYRNQGAEALRQRIIAALNKDAVVTFTVPAHMLEKIIEIVEETK